MAEAFSVSEKRANNENEDINHPQYEEYNNQYVMMAIWRRDKPGS
jgi:hypothetical protein